MYAIEKNIHGPWRINPKNVGDPMTFNQAPPIDHSVTCPALLWMTEAKLIVSWLATSMAVDI